MNKKGQALVEFVLILPVFIFLILVMYDFGRIFNLKNRLESNGTDIILLYKDGKSLDDIKVIYPDLEISISNDSDYYKVEIQDSIKLYTPGFNLIFGNPYKINVARYIPYE